MNVSEVKILLDEEIRKITQLDLIDTIEKYRIEPRIENREWDYSQSFTEYPCCIVLEDKDTNTVIAYCANGFGPSDPWGLMFLEGKFMSMGMDSGWFTSLEDAVRNAMFWHGDDPSDYEVQ